jgi:hypothetical protein
MRECVQRRFLDDVIGCAAGACFLPLLDNYRSLAYFTSFYQSFSDYLRMDGAGP